VLGITGKNADAPANRLQFITMEIQASNKEKVNLNKNVSEAQLLTTDLFLDFA